jgi:NAD(P)-dependent dehydrogenase (short-subunit alcohol dehydrogenase family)
MSASATPRIVWITGGTSGIGTAAAKRFADGGDIVFASSRTAVETDASEAPQPGSVTNMRCDVCSESEVAAAYGRITGSCGRVDVLINCAGVTVFKPFAATSAPEFDAILNTNLRGPFVCTNTVLPAMLERQSGTVVMINSMSSRDVFRNSSVYAASKAGLKMMTDCLRSEVRKQGVRVLSVHPGATKTSIWPESTREKYGSVMMDPAQVADVIFCAVNTPEMVLVEDLYVQPIGGPL